MANNLILTGMMFSSGKFYFVEEHGTKGKKEKKITLVFQLLLLPVQL